MKDRTDRALLTGAIMCVLALSLILGGAIVIAFATEPITTSFVTGLTVIFTWLAWVVAGRWSR